MKAMQEIFLAPSSAVSIIEILKSEKFCQDPSLAFTEEQIKECQDYITQFIPVAMKELFTDLGPPSWNCNFYFDLECPVKTFFENSAVLWINH